MNALKKKLYIGCPLTGLPEDVKESYLAGVERLKAILGSHFEIMSFLGLVAGSPCDVYRRDIKECVGTADCFLALCDYHGTGLGYELAVAVEKRGIPTLAATKKGAKVSRMVIGIEHENYRFVRYQSLEHVAGMTVGFFLMGIPPTSDVS